jgi:hypothetical protein
MFRSVWAIGRVHVVGKDSLKGTADNDGCGRSHQKCPSLLSVMMQGFYRLYQSISGRFPESNDLYLYGTFGAAAVKRTQFVYLLAISDAVSAFDLENPVSDPTPILFPLQMAVATNNFTNKAISLNIASIGLTTISRLKLI